MKRIFILLCSIVLCYSCSSSDSETTPEPQQQSEPNFYALTVGNSWVYKNYRYNLNTQMYDDTGVIDSISIVGTQVISGNTYFKFRRLTTGNETGITFCNPNGEHFEYLREFEGALITDDGGVKYVNNNYEERQVSDADWGITYDKLQQNTIMVTVDLGTFECLDMHRYAKDTDENLLPALDHHNYSDGIGLIYDTTSFVSQSNHSIERRLDSYNVQ